MAAPKVNEKLLQDLEEMGFPRARATRALYYSGNTGLEDAINWTIDHENDPDIDEMPLESEKKEKKLTEMLPFQNQKLQPPDKEKEVDIDIDIESSESFPITEEMRIKAHKLREQELKRKEDERKKLEREREKERIQAGKKLLEAKRIAEEYERQRNLALRKAEKEEEKRARERVLQKLKQDKINRRPNLGLTSEGQANARSSAIVIHREKLQNPKPVYPTAKVEYLRECLRSLKRKHQGEHGRVRKAFETLLIYVGNVVKNPNEEKYRKIRLSNPLFQERVGSLNGGIEFLELCGFERTGDFLYLPQEKVDMAMLKSAGDVLNSAMANPFFGLFSTPLSS